MTNNNEANEYNKKEVKVHPKEKSNFLSHLFFWWELFVIIDGFKKEFTEKDLFEPLKDHKAKTLGDKLEEIWDQEVNTHQNPSLKRALMKLYGGVFLIYSLFFLPLRLISLVLTPLAFGKILEYFMAHQTAMTAQEAYIYGAILILLLLLEVATHHSFLLVFKSMGMKLRIACCSLIYRKSLKMNQNILNKFTIGHIINLMSNDLNRFNVALDFSTYLLISPIENIIMLYVLYIILGHTALAGIGVYLVCLLTQIYLSKKLSNSRLNVALKTDQRINLTNEMICGIQIIKMYAWQKPFVKLVESARRLELEKITTHNYMYVFYLIHKSFLTKISLFFCFLTSILNGIPPDAQYYFTALVFYDLMRISLTINFAYSIVHFSEFIISVERIEKFLISITRKDTNEKKNCILKKIKMKSNLVGIYARNIYVKHDVSQSNYVLNDVSINVAPNELIAVVGPAGSGKSILLLTILKEIEVVKGTLDVFGTISYACQEPWIFRGTVEENILFGREMNTKKYLQVIKVCALEHDLAHFPYGDQTRVGERGANLSGGQKARINLARAVYRDADIYLLDDPLSAVDAHVAKHIFEECILRYLNNKCVILVTHQIQFLKNFKIYKVENGSITACEKVEEIFVKTKERSEIINNIIETEVIKKFDHSNDDEELRTRTVRGIKAFKKCYAASGNGLFSLFSVILLYILAQVSAGGTDYFGTFWVNLEEEKKEISFKRKNYENQSHIVTTEKPFFTTENCLYIYGALTIMIVLFTLLRSLLLLILSNKASKNIHRKMFTNVVNATMTFFNANPSGRIMNRFSNDMGIIDETLPSLFMDTLHYITIVFSLLILVSLTNPWLIVSSVILLFILIGSYYVIGIVNGNFKRTEAITQSSVLSHIADTLKGLSTIRVNEVERILEKQFDKLLDANTSVYYLLPAVHSCVGFWVELFCVFYIFSVVASVFVADIRIGAAGLGIVQALSTKKLLPFGIKIWCDVDTNIVPLKRVVEYIELNTERDEVKTISETWPSEGNIEFQSISLQYSVGDPYVLNQVNFKINAGEKIGIVGRTGAGKSSLISVLFRLFDFEGKVIIDGYDTKEIPLDSLRSKISIIPQTPTLFSTTLRKNLDPFDEYSDSHIWSALKEVELRNISNLDNVILEGGSNFSVGEKQLLCMARALLRKNKIIVLDEATANVDLTTDKLIQTTVKEKFKNCTVLTIAHRLNTVMDSDKILVMDNGSVVEFDTPQNLLQNANGFFYALHLNTV